MLTLIQSKDNSIVVPKDASTPKKHPSVELRLKKATLGIQIALIQSRMVISTQTAVSCLILAKIGEFELQKKNLSENLPPISPLFNSSYERECRKIEKPRIS